jgi:hypothetical protein
MFLTPVCVLRNPQTPADYRPALRALSILIREFIELELRFEAP